MGKGAIAEKVIKADSLYKVGNYVEAEDLYIEVIERDSFHLHCLLQMAHIAIKFNNYQNVLIYANQALKANSRSSKAHNLIGLCKLNDKDIAGAKESFEQAISLNPEDPSNYVNIANAYSQDGDYLKAIDATERGLNLSPCNGQYYNNLAVYYSKIGDLDASIKYYKKSLQLLDCSINTPYNLAYILLSSGKVDEAIDLVDEVLNSSIIKTEMLEGLKVVKALGCF